MAGQTATIISTISSDVVTYWERGSLVAEFRVGRYTIKATGWPAYSARRLTKGARVKIVGETSTREWVSKERGKDAVVKSRSSMHCIIAQTIMAL